MINCLTIPIISMYNESCSETEGIKPRLTRIRLGETAVETLQTPSPIPFARPFIGEEEEEAVLRVLRSGWLTTGPEALAFEKEFTLALQSNSLPDEPGLFCLAVNSATSGLHLALEACGVRQGDIVLVPSYTFTASAEVVRYLGAEPVFVDSLPGGFHIDPHALEETITKLLQGKNPYGKGTGVSGQTAVIAGKPKAIIPVHFAGLACDMESIMDIASRYELKVIEDAAHSFPIAGITGDAAVFSFYTTKTIATGEGGMVACKDEQMVERVSLMRTHGIDRCAWNRYTDTRASWRYEVIEAGFKYNMSDVLASLGRVQLGRAGKLLSMRQEIAARYDLAFSGDERFIIPPSGADDARHLYPLRINPSTLKISRDEFIERLQEQGIGVSVHFIPLHTMPFYKNRCQIAEADLPCALASYKQEISLPIWPGMSEPQVNRVIDVVKSIAELNIIN
jgi:dTDP-4-amino-4,6-dideoxygalactose transaminase